MVGYIIGYVVKRKLFSLAGLHQCSDGTSLATKRDFSHLSNLCKLIMLMGHYADDAHQHGVGLSLKYRSNRPLTQSSCALAPNYSLLYGLTTKPLRHEK